MKILIFLSMLFMFGSCGTSDDPSSPSDTPNDSDTLDDSDSSSDQDRQSNIACKCRGLGDEPVWGRSPKNEEHAKLLAGAVCSALQPEKDILKDILQDKENMSEEDRGRIQSIIEQALQDVLAGNVNNSVLNLVYDCHLN